MSDFTYVNLISFKDKEIAKKCVDTGEYLLYLNEKWSLFLTKYDDKFNNKGEKLFSASIMKLSEKTPILFFIHPEDHGFGFSILHKKKTLCSFFLNYENDIHGLSLQIANEMYDDGVEIWMNDMERFKKLAFESGRREKYISNILSNLDIDLFHLFELLPITIAKLKELFTEQVFLHTDWIKITDNFMNYLDIQKLNFISHHYVVNHEEQYSKIYPIIAKG